MIQVYDEYTHLTLDRRGLHGKAEEACRQRRGGGGNRADAREQLCCGGHRRRPTIPRLKIEEITYPGPDGAVKGYLAMPADAAGKLPAVIVIHENRGLNPHIKDVTRRLALEGFVALARRPSVAARAGRRQATRRRAAMFQVPIARRWSPMPIAAIPYLQKLPSTNGKVGAVGFCFGGGIVNQMAVASPDLVAAVAYYGRSAGRRGRRRRSRRSSSSTMPVSTSASTPASPPTKRH